MALLDYERNDTFDKLIFEIFDKSYETSDYKKYVKLFNFFLLMIETFCAIIDKLVANQFFMKITIFMTEKKRFSWKKPNKTKRLSIKFE